MVEYVVYRVSQTKLCCTREILIFNVFFIYFFIFHIHVNFVREHRLFAYKSFPRPRALSISVLCLLACTLFLFFFPNLPFHVSHVCLPPLQAITKSDAVHKYVINTLKLKVMTTTQSASTTEGGGPQRRYRMIRLIVRARGVNRLCRWM